MRSSLLAHLLPALVAIIALSLLNPVVTVGTVGTGVAAPATCSGPRTVCGTSGGSPPEAGASGRTSPDTGSSPAVHPLGTGSNVTFNESGLPLGTDWSVVLNATSNSSTVASVLFSVAYGTYPFTVPSVPGYVPSPATGTISASLPSVYENISFSPFTFPLTFTETGLPAATSWGINVSGASDTTSTATISQNVANGSYSYVVLAPAGYTASPTNGSAVVLNASAIVPIVFVAIHYLVVFSQTGLTGTNWSVNVSGVVNTSNGSSLSFLEPNGTLSYSVGFVAGFQATPTSGSLVVNGADVNQSLTFVAIPPSKYPVSFNETGLAAGTNWSVQLNVENLSSTGSTVVFLKANGTFLFTVAPVPGYNATPANGSVHVRGATYLPITFTPVRYAVNFSETGLPAGTSWAVDLGTYRSMTSLPYAVFSVANGSLRFVVEPVPGFRVAPGSGTVNISGAAVEVSLTFSAVLYALDWTETGLPGGTHWSVTVDGVPVSGASNRLSGTQANGTYAFSIGAVPGFVAYPPSGTVTVNGSSLVRTISFSSFDFPVTLTETGLPSGTYWSASVGGAFLSSPTPSLLFAKGNGTYTYHVSEVAGYTVAPTSGNLTVAGAGVSRNVTYTPLPPGTYSVLFTESGLPDGTNWSVTLGTTLGTSITSQVLFGEHNGTYSYAVGPVTGFTASPVSGSVPVEGAPQSIAIHFRAVPPPDYAVGFSESGLPANLPWSVTFNGSLLAGPSPLLTALVPNGSYAFTVGAVDGFIPTPTGGPIVVNGSSLAVAINFTGPVHSTVTFSESGLAIGAGWSVTLNDTTQSSAGIALVFTGVSAGTYPFTVRASGYSALPASGNVTVVSTPVVLNLAFTATGTSHPSNAGSGLSNSTLVFLGAMGLVLLVAAGIALATRERRRTPP
jgi:hypothetical protein